MIDPSRITEMASAFQDSAVLFAASDLGVFGALAKVGEGSAEALAAELSLDQRATGLILNACVAVGLLEKHGDLYRNTAESAAFLVPGCPHDLSKAIRYMRDVYPAWGRLASFGKSGEPVEAPQLHLGTDAERTRTFVLSMHGKALATAQPVLSQLSIAGCRRLLDVGGGPGTYSVLLCRMHPGLHATVLDLPPVIDIARDLIEQQGASGRVDTLAGDYHSEPFPQENDCVLFFGMLHQESAEGIQNLMQKAYRSMLPGGVVYVMDMMTDPSHTTPKFSALFGVNMGLTTRSGWVFSSDELRRWLVEAGFTDVGLRHLPPPIPHWLVSARKPW